MDWVLIIVGAALAIVVLRDVFHTLFHPVGHGSIAPWVMRLVWRALRWRRTRPGTSLTGPLGIVAVIGTWAATATAGWTLIYLAHMPEGFRYGSELDPATRNDVLDSLYLSLVTLATLGFGDIMPESPWLRVLVPLEGLFGFVLFTAAVSWVLQIYPALHRRRVLALQLSTLRAARRAAGGTIDDVPVDVLTMLGSSLIEARNDFTQYGATYYFRDVEADSSLAASLDYATDLADEARASEHPQTRMAGAVLDDAVERLAELLGQEFLRMDGDTDALVAAYAADHGHGGG
ncbi:potassium channel family protein [Mycobacterium sp. PS03-16]|uniref:potassium channel family protein n=1 Tax=Mycobacterium sp. PS03-16 TaxID=2559611 RepID=UPI001FD85D1D|nr:potassium channel family protein [Mycobacterium sp. PS03-16]